MVCALEGQSPLRRQLVPLFGLVYLCGTPRLSQTAISAQCSSLYNHPVAFSSLSFVEAPDQVLRCSSLARSLKMKAFAVALLLVSCATFMSARPLDDVNFTEEKFKGHMIPKPKLPPLPTLPSLPKCSPPPESPAYESPPYASPSPVYESPPYASPSPVYESPPYASPSPDYKSPPYSPSPDYKSPSYSPSPAYKSPPAGGY